MKNIKTKIIILASFISTFGMFGISQAATVYLETSPSTIIRNVQSNFTVSIRLVTDSPIYAVEGTLVFNNLNCKNITLSQSVVVQSMPTCSNPYFLVGIPSGTNIDMDLFQIVVSGNSVGAASLGFLNVDLIGAGNSLSNSSLSGIFEITPVPVVNVPEVVTPAPVVVPVISTTTETSTSSEVIATTSEVVAAPVETKTPGNSFVATVLETLSNIKSSTRFAVSAALVLIVLGIGPVFLRKIEDQI